MKRWFAIFALGFVVACRSAPGAVDSGAQMDAGVNDAGPSDAGPNDAGSTDAGAPDSGSSLDAGCDQPLIPGPDAGSCVFPPVLDLGDCPQYIGVSCVVSFTPVTIGSQSTEAITLFNNGDAPMHVSALELVAPAPPEFTLLTGMPPPIPPHAYASVSVRFAPDDAGLFRATLHLATDAYNVPDRLVPVEGATPDSACAGQGDCLITETCSSGTCTACPGITPPPCAEGNLISVTDGNGCPQPTCRCPDGKVYASGGHCIAPTACEADGGCASGTCDATACCSFPFCLCPIDGGACR